MKLPERRIELSNEQSGRLTAIVLRHFQHIIDDAGAATVIAPTASVTQRGLLALTVSVSVGAHSVGHTLCTEGCPRVEAEKRLDMLVQQVREHFAAGYLVAEHGVVPDVLPPL